MECKNYTYKKSEDGNIQSRRTGDHVGGRGGALVLVSSLRISFSNLSTPEVEVFTPLAPCLSNK